MDKVLLGLCDRAGILALPNFTWFVSVMARFKPSSVAMLKDTLKGEVAVWFKLMKTQKTPSPHPIWTNVLHLHLLD